MAVSEKAIGQKKDVVISIGFQIEDTRKTFNKIKSQLRTLQSSMKSELSTLKTDIFLPKQDKLKREVAAYKNAIRDITTYTSGAMSGQKKQLSPIEIGAVQAFRDKIKTANAQMSKNKELYAEMSQNIKKRYSPALLQAEKNLNVVTNTLDMQRGMFNKNKLELQQMQNEFKKGQVPFRGYAMSIMFFGMALQRTFNSIWKGSTKVFQDVMHSTEGTVTGFDELQGSLKYLGFTVGEALEPIATFLTPIIDGISEWASQNQGLISTATTMIGIFGMAFAVGGALWLATDGFRNMSFALAGMRTDAQKLGKYDWAGLGKTIRKGIGFILVGIGVGKITQATIDAAKDDFITTTQKVIAGTALGVAGVALATGNLKTAGAALVVGVSMDLLAKDEFFQTFMRTVGFVSAVVNAFLDQISLRIQKLFTPSLWGKDVIPSFKELFEEYYTSGIQGGMLMDKEIGKWKDEMDEKIMEKAYPERTTQTGITSVNIDSFIAMGVPPEIIANYQKGYITNEELLGIIRQVEATQ